LPSAERSPQIASGKRGDRIMSKGAKKVSQTKKSKPPPIASPVAQLQHLELAEEYFQAFRDLPRNGPSGIPVNWPRYFALCHAAELALKAFLLAYGWTDEQISSYPIRHNISDLMAQAIAVGLKISGAARSGIDLLSQAHKEFWHRYPKPTGDPVYVVDDFEKYVVELLTAVALAIRGGNRLWVNY
jgi:hypothetical protein